MDGRIAQLISRAEHHIAQEEYSNAIACLDAAEQIEPGNRSVRMLKELLTSLQSRAQRKTFLMRFFPRRLPKSIERTNAEAPLGENELRKRVSSLTGRADYHLAHGAVESAYKSLQRASVLDPLSPDVLACEKRVLPALQQLRAKNSVPIISPTRIRKPSSPQKIQSSLYERLKNGNFFA
jgi:hypothetical protein